MTNISNIPHDHYDKKIPGNIRPGRVKHQYTMPAKNFQPGYKISNRIKNHIVESTTRNTNQSIKFQDFRVAINTQQKTLALKFAYFINNQYIDPAADKNFNLQIEVLANHAHFILTEGVYDNLEIELTSAVEKFSRLVFNFVQKHSSNLENLAIKEPLLSELFKESGQQILGSLGTIISIIHAKGKYKNHSPEMSLYKKQTSGQKNHIPGFEIQKNDLDIQFKVNNPPLYLTQEIQHPQGFLQKLFGTNFILPELTFLNHLWHTITQNHLITTLRQQIGGLAWTNLSDPVNAKKRTTIRTAILVIVIIILLVIVIYG